MKTKTIPFAFLAISATCLALPMTAAELASDSFNTYSPGLLGGNADGSGWTGAWVAGSSANVANVIDTSMNPLIYSIPGGATLDGGIRAVEITGTANALVVSRDFAGGISSDFFVGTMIRVGAGSWTDTDTFGIHLADNTLNPSSTLNFGLRGPDTAIVRNATGTPVTGASTSVPTTVGEVNYLVARVSKASGSSTFNRLDLWVNPDQDSIVTAPDGDASVELAAGTGLSSITHLFPRVAVLETGDSIQFDELLVGNAWGDVVAVPEPSTWALLSGGLLLLAVRLFRPRHGIRENR